MSGRSKKPSLLFVDHEFHRKTRSFHFLIDILSQRFDVKTVYVDPSRSQDYDTLIDDSEYVLLAQMDFLTPHFIAAGKKVCVVQMYDGSAGLPDSHWQMNRQARYLNFSVALHARALAAGADSLLVRYFPNPADFSPVEDFSTLRGFFWQRLPKSPVNLSAVARLAGKHLDQLHVHTPADDGTLFDPAPLEAFDCPVTTSDWFESHADFKAQLDKANVYFAPRLAEGIGHGFLEALAKGMIVIAFNKPTHNEYINNGTSGILYDENVGDLNLTDLQDKIDGISRNARAAVAAGHARFQASHPDIIDFVLGTPAARVPAIPGLDHVLHEIEQAYIGGVPSYTKALDKFEKLRSVMSDWDRLEDEVAHAKPVGDDSLQRDVHLFFGKGNAQPFMTHGWSVAESTHTWAIEVEADVQLNAVREGEVARIVVEARALRRNTLRVSVNGVSFGETQIDGQIKPLIFTPKTPVPIRPGDVVTITLSVAEPEALIENEYRPLQFAVKSLSLEAAS